MKHTETLRSSVIVEDSNLILGVSCFGAPCTLRRLRDGRANTAEQIHLRRKQS